jgi:hypothetical protein
MTGLGPLVHVDRQGISSLDRHGVIEMEPLNKQLPPSVQFQITFASISINRSIQMYSMYEAFARERSREQLEQSAQRRLAHDVASARMWHRLASFSARRAARSSRRVADHAAAEYQLVG